MVGENCHPAADGEPVECSGKYRWKGLHLAVDGNTQCLKGALGGMPRTLVPNSGGDRLGDDVDEASGGLNGLTIPLCDDGPHDAIGELLLAVLAQDPHQVAWGGRVDDLGGSTSTRLVHAHVQPGIDGV